MIFLTEIKNRLFLILLSFIFTFLVCYLYKETILFLIVKPNYLNFSKIKLNYFIFTNAIEIFYAYLELVLFICFQFIILYFLYHLFLFFSPALFFKEFILVFYIIRFAIIVWIFLINLLNFCLVPLFWDFFLSFQSFSNYYSINLHFEAKLSEYLNFYTNLYYLSLFYSQLFISMLFFLFYNVIYSIKIIKKLRKIFYFSFFIIATIMSPPDVLCQIFLSFLTILLYEFLLFLFLIRFYIKQVTS